MLVGSLAWHGVMHRSLWCGAYVVVKFDEAVLSLPTKWETLKIAGEICRGKRSRLLGKWMVHRGERLGSGIYRTSAQPLPNTGVYA